MAATTEQGPSSTITTTIDPKVAKLRDILQTADNGNPVHAFIIPSEDPHMVRRVVDHHPVGWIKMFFLYFFCTSSNSNPHIPSFVHSYNMLYYILYV